MKTSPRTRQSLQNAVIFCTDQAGLPVTLFAAHSVAKCNKDRRFDILICSLTPLDLPTFITDLGIRNHVLSVQATIDAQSLKRVLPSTAYLRLWLPEYFANQYSRILYLDYDTVTQSSDINALFTVDLGDRALAGVLDKLQWHHADKPVHDFWHLNIDCTKYLNTGVLLIDCAKWQGQDLTRTILDVSHTLQNPHFHDQSLVNVALQGAWAELSPVWNWQIAANFPRLTQQYSPKILHFAGRQKPWLLGQSPSMLPRNYIDAYQVFFQANDLPQQFSIDPQTLTPPLRNRLRATFKHIKASARIRRLMARYHDPLTTLI